VAKGCILGIAVHKLASGISRRRHRQATRVS
jgi:hypothetical protein